MASQENRCSSVAHATIVRGERVAPTYYNHFPKISSACLGSTQIVCSLGITVACCVCFGFLVGLLMTFLLQFPLMALIAGSCGINAGVHKTTCKIVTNLVLSILASINSCALTIGAIIVLASSETLAEYNYQQRGQNNFGESVIQMRGYFVALLILSLIETVAAITSAVIGCHFVCFCCKRCCCQFDVTTTDQVVMLHSDDEEQLLPGNVALPRNDGDVPMIAVDGATGLVQPYLASNVAVSAPSYMAYPK